MTALIHLGQPSKDCSRGSSRIGWLAAAAQELSVTAHELTAAYPFERCGCFAVQRMGLLAAQAAAACTILGAEAAASACCGKMIRLAKRISSRIISAAAGCAGTAEVALKLLLATAAAAAVAAAAAMTARLVGMQL